MRDARLTKIAKTICDYSLQIKKGQNLMVRGHHHAKPLLKEVCHYANTLGANVYFELFDDELSALCTANSSEVRAENTVKWNMPKYKEMDAFCSVYATENEYELKNVSEEIKRRNARIMRPLSNVVVNEKKWVLLDYPTHALAQTAKMPYDDFYDFVVDVCSFDYSKLGELMKPLKELLLKTDKVRIVSPGTDLTFSIKDIPVVICSGENNIPDGEIFTAPVKDSVNGTITYNTPSPQSGQIYNQVSLEFKDGKIVKASCDGDNDALNKIFDTDEGSRFVGEFALGVNPMIMNPMGNILFDEKIAGSLHFTPGQAYEDADNGNRSALHWDLVLIQREEFGGGQIYFDDVLVRDNGKFVLPELENLNWDKF